ncbi:MAG: site-specific DNA-methyltransferase [Chloroflexi bacterium]|nr:site-specific DNA-methyltransferase [Chloroflexota bacterium]
MNAMPLPLAWSEDGPKVERLKDPTNSGNKSLSLHRWANWIAGFSAEFVNSAIDRYLSPTGAAQATVLDPFAGVGTTNVEALRRGFQTCGFELNAFAALAARCKLEVARLDLDLLRTTIDQYATSMRAFECHVDRWWDALARGRQPYPGPVPRARPPELFRTREPFFSKPVELKVLWTLDFIGGIEDPTIQDYFRLALGSTLVSYSNYSYEPSLCSRSKLGKPLVENASVGAAIASKLEHMVADAVELRSELSLLPQLPRAHIVQGSFFDALSHLAPGSIDLAITSPPYLNNYHYVRNTRPQLYWLGFVTSPADAARLEKQSFGKFWQTVRDGQAVELCFNLPGLESQLAELRTLRSEHGIYGGSGWANYVASYFNDSYRFLGLLRTLLKPGGHAVVVVGNSLLQGMDFRVDEVLSQIATLHGLDAQVERIRSKRVGNSIVGTGLRQKPQNGRPELYEAAVIVKR